MSPLIQLNLNDVPDELLPIQPGVRTLTVKDITAKDSSKGKPMLEVDLEVDEPGHPDHGRPIRDWFTLDPRFATGLKRFWKACGLSFDADGIDPTDAIGKTVKAVIVNTTYTDKDTGETKEQSKVGREKGAQNYLAG
jgi:hypothetical protein